MDLNFSVGEWADVVVNYILDHFTPALDMIAATIGFVTDSIQNALLAVPPIGGVAVLTLLSLWRVGWKFAVFTALALGLIIHMDLWIGTMESLSLVLASTVIAVVIGIPLGIAMARSDTVASIVRPVLDLMQTMPAFVYLIPAAMFFGLGAVPGTIATVIFAMPPVVRLTNLGIRQVHSEFVEAGLAFGCTSRQLLFKVQLPNALPSIMAGINQTIMLSLSMVVIASMIGAGGLGNTVLTGIQRLNVGLGFEGGLAVVILAVILDRITQSFGKGGAGFFKRLASLRKAADTQSASSFRKQEA
ncbi:MULTISPECIES: ABC transporter permease [Brucella/Ochrobactrum group]|jgi:glycine betaine/proline transport system permease protein|uniref:Proline/glycine betaine ABC transporter permease n=1 Tax=Brucella pseudintermedia TaxID=370111 RepID=A0ABY5UJX0_9HYPH|nr:MULTISPECIES: proline/glycine betaine ABC transporter permease [Brucella/Ochrobactrum group]KAB2684654.1 proline/glycine betaine ABC transporter permease [Brucella pseudintermedia]NKE74640.1 proline/glycine betaine ABC transporter permease [Ochrobactrum sp. MC-1LL]TWG97567.1 glycine betaine/proline transport system permease protein [Ochrobactrum sp. J50]UWL62070.1 proline/glycine betaine ABC transporter permease [Brucella pseudintermedia]WPM82542.1 proline/glycine betaine ABC transporter pe